MSLHLKLTGCCVQLEGGACGVRDSCWGTWGHICLWTLSAAGASCMSPLLRLHCMLLGGMVRMISRTMSP